MAMHDSVASFYGGYDQVGFPRRATTAIPRKWVAIGVAAAILMVAIAADGAAYAASGSLVKVSVVDWYVEGVLLASAAGFTMHTAATITVSLTCNSLCFRVVGVAVAAPFQQIDAQVNYAPIQYVNVTVSAPAAPYSGPLAITLEIP